ncbi:MAG: M48 family metallopeptidase [Porticoccaceae bacterium]
MAANLCLVLFALVVSGCEIFQTIDKGLYQISETITEKDQITGKRSINLSDREKQIQIGNAAIEEMLAEKDSANEAYNGALDKRAYERVVAIFNRVHAVSHLRNESWTPILVKDENFNAFTTGGTYIVVNTGLEKELGEDDQLAAVIAHEIAHTVAGHPSESGSYGLIGNLAGSKSAQRESFQIAFNHEQEKEADEIGVLYSALAGFDPMSASRIWESQLIKNGVNAAYLNGHPHNLERIKFNKITAGKILPYYTRNKINERYESLLDENVLYKKNVHSEADPGAGGGLSSILNTYIELENKKNQATAEEARQRARISMMKNAQKNFIIVDSKPVSPNIWRVHLKYQGLAYLKELVLKGAFQTLKGETLVIIAQHPAIVVYGSIVVVDFSHPDLYAYNQQANKLSFTLDYAERF